MLENTRYPYPVYRFVDAHLISHLYYVQLNNTPLHYAACKGHTAVIQLLLQAGADKDIKNNVSTY